MSLRCGSGRVDEGDNRTIVIIIIFSFISVHEGWSRTDETEMAMAVQVPRRGAHGNRSQNANRKHSTTSFIHPSHLCPSLALPQIQRTNTWLPLPR
jgi:hypothetical protein